MRHLDQAKVRGKTVLVRVDFNVSLRRGRVEDDARMRRTLPTVRWLLRRGAKVVLVSHLGRPKRVEEAFSLRPLARHLAGLLKMKVHFFAENPAILREVVAALPRGSVSLLENIRFWPGEEKNSTQLARALASLADIFVNDAFGVAHRKGASLIAITRYLPSYAGFLLIEELAALDKVRAARMRPFAMILGGAKLSDKLPLIHQFSRRVDYILTGGGVANTLAKAKGVNIAKSLYDPSLMKVAKQLLKTKKIFVPVDWKKSDGKILDIGPKSAALYAEKIRQANMILWNGPVGLVEEKRFQMGSRVIARAIAKNRHAFSVVGGGDTIAFFQKAIPNFKILISKRRLFVSTGGGAMLEYLAGKKLSAVEALQHGQRK